MASKKKRPVGRPKAAKPKGRIISFRSDDDDYDLFQRAAEKHFETDPDRPNKLGTWARAELRKLASKVLGEE
jgi:hypothetical protein